MIVLDKIYFKTDLIEIGRGSRKFTNTNPCLRKYMDERMEHNKRDRTNDYYTDTQIFVHFLLLGTVYSIYSYLSSTPSCMSIHFQDVTEYAVALSTCKPIHHNLHFISFININNNGNDNANNNHYCS